MIAYVVLHYLAEEMTMKCVEKLRIANRGKEYKIVIVDNCSANGSGRKLQKKVENYPECIVLLLDNNYGFAKGNNYGYSFAKSLSPEFIVVINNDLIIEDQEFYEKLQRAYSETQFGVLGPDIVSKKTGAHQNPCALEPLDEIALEKRINELKKDLSRSKINYYFYHIIKRVCEVVNKQHSNNNYYMGIKYNVVLHGSCYVFSRNYFENEEYAFNPNTFLYYEENLLHIHCQKKNYLMVYYPYISVTHYEDVSTNYERLEKYEKMRRINQHKIQSAQVLLDSMKG